METGKKLKLLVVILALLVVGLACDLTTTETPQPTAQPNIQAASAIIQEPTALVAAPTMIKAGNVQPPTAANPIIVPVGNENLSSTQKQQLAKATVRVAIMKKSVGKLEVIGFGSGTLLTRDGLILTNCHVADPFAMGMPDEEVPDALVIELVVTEDHPPHGYLYRETDRF